MLSTPSLHFYFLGMQHSAKLAVFRAFCSSFDDTAKQFTSGPALQFAQKFSSSFLQYWTDVLAGTHTNLPTTKPSYATVTLSPQLRKINGNNQPRVARGNAIHCLHRLTTSGSSPAPQKFSSSFLQYWTDVLAGTHTNLPPTKPSYAAAVGARRPAPAAAGTTADPVSAAPQNQWQQQLPPRRQGQRKPLPPLTDDFRVFARLRPGHTADMSRSFAVRTHIADKLGIARSRIPEAHPCKTGWAIRAADLATRDLLTERQAEWASDISAEIVEKRQEWYTYAVQGCPRRFNNIFGEAIDDEKAIRDEVATQTGQTPERVMTGKQDSEQRPTRTLFISFAKEVKHYWRLFDTTSYARLIVKTKPPKQCDNCWDYHSRYSCGRQARCKNCGKTGHAQDTCTATQQCANCHGPHAVDFPQCPARPKKVNGAFHSLNRPEKKLVQIMGKRLFKQFTAKPASPPRDQSTSLESDSATASDTTSASSRSTPTTSDAITPEPERENRASRPSETPSASSAAPAAPNSQASPTPSSGSSSSGRQNTAASASPIKPTSATPMNERRVSPPVRQSIEMSEEPHERQHRDKRLFRVFQANVGKNGPSHDCALALADAERYEVILLQEPWTQVRDSRCLTKTHPAYDTYSPVSTWEDIDTRPRVMTYIRRGARLLADQQRPALSRDILWLVVNGVTLVNVYREPNLDTALEVLFAWPIPSQCIIAGDFNARLHTWQIGPSRGHGGIIAEWAAENDLDLLNPINTPTNSARRRSRPHGWRGCCAEGRHALLWLGRRGSWDPDRKDHHYEAGWTRPMPSPPPPPAAQGAGWADYGLHAKKVKMQGRMLRKAARKRFEEGQTTLEEAEPYRILTATMPVDALTADWSMGSNRPIQEKHVNALYTIFQRGDMKRARYPLAVLSTRSEVQCMLHEMGYDGDTPDADDVPSFDKWLLVNGRPVELLDGQHRVAPLKRIVSGSGSGKQELYWPCNIYDRGMPHATAAEADVVLWLSSILDLKNEPLPILTESDRVNYDGGHRKRRKLGTHRHRLPSPPSSEPTSSMADLPPSSMKRSRDPDDPANLARWDMSSAQSDETQDQSTPRPGRLQQTQTTEWIPFSAGSSHGSQSWTSSPSSRSAPVLKRPKSTSSRTSPSRQLRNAEINQTGFRMGSFRLDTYPDSLNALRCELRDIGLGDGILPASLEHELRRADSEIPRFAFDRDEATRALTEAIATDLPPIDWVQALMKRADECELNRECESSWNGEIHAAILEQAFRTNRFVSNGPVDFRYAQAAQIVHAYKPREAPSKMVDFCVFCRPAKGSAEEQAIDDICQTRPAQSINHTDLGDFCKRPIALSIETKRPKVDRDDATLQIGTWQSTQWRSLRHNSSQPLESIEFLPGIIVQGHDWQFVASVLDENDKSVLLKGLVATASKNPDIIHENVAEMETQMLRALQLSGEPANDRAVVRDDVRQSHLPDLDVGLDDLPLDRRLVVHGVSTGLEHPRAAARRRREACFVRGLEADRRLSRRRADPRTGAGSLLPRSTVQAGQCRERTRKCLSLAKWPAALGHSGRLVYEPVASAFARKIIASFASYSYIRIHIRATMSPAGSLSPVSPAPQSFASYLPATSTGTTPEAPSDDASQCEFDIDWENIWHGGKRLVGAKKRPRHRRVVGAKMKESWIYRHGANLEHKGIRYWLCKICHKQRSYSTALYASSGTAHAARHLLRQHHVAESSGGSPSLTTPFTLAATSASTPPRPLSRQSTLGFQLASLFDERSWKARFVDWIILEDVTFRQASSERLGWLIANGGEPASQLLPEHHATVCSWIRQSFESRQQIISSLVKGAKSCVHLSFDLWTASNGFHYIGVVGHFVDGGGK
ncbi:hypothetical protein PCL_00034 [Purpureocillium lilacinum]|uniref:CCHC-type domain-containing protein n=1 Tax=Purpureocillium lilacinum TaxID=33203 RepID=A0A2U3DP66_PURLI|nr:hypothetical protein PCL_00034 [Purpureocillium lilacinum]